MKSSKSIRERLLNLSRKEEIPFQQILYRYFHERFIYRISISAYANSFVLKGGNLLYVNQGLLTRPTTDIDFLAIGLTNDIAIVERAFIEICNMQCPNDKVFFDSDSIESMLITEHKQNSGLRLVVAATFDSIKQKVQIDIGYGDIVIPHAKTIDYPVLLYEMPAPVISAYTNETVIAEKFHAMIELASFNSRMKDFYDVYMILETGKYDKGILGEAIEATFANRNTNYSDNHILFTNEFANDKNRTKAWFAFLKKINVDNSIDFPHVMNIINVILYPIWNQLKEKTK